MSQTVDLSFAAKNAQAAKDVDFILAIAGWPTLYSVVRGDYSIPASGELSSASGFTGVKPWMNAPAGAAAKVKGRPEEGGMTIGQFDLEIVDRVSTGRRALTDLVSRRAYLDGTVTPNPTDSLNGAISRTATSITFHDGTKFADGSLHYISQECIKLGTRSGNTFSGCTRGYLLTDAVSHADNVKSYGFLPSLYRRVGHFYKGYQSLPLDKWAKLIGGPITEDSKDGALVKLSVMSQTWETFNRVGRPWVNAASPALGKAVNDILGLDFTNVVVNVNSIGNLNSGNYFVVMDGEVAPILGAV